MPMITLASFVVVPNPLFAGGTVEQAVLEAMNARRYGLRNFPDDHLDDGPVVANFFGSRKQRGLHLLHDSNTRHRSPADAARSQTVAHGIAALQAAPLGSGLAPRARPWAEESR